MLRRTQLATQWSVYTLVGLTLAILVDDTQAQLRGRRLLRRDAKEMEEYYDDLEDYYEDRNPRLAREAELMENYYKDVRRGRAVAPPRVSLPGVRLLLDPRSRLLGDRDRQSAAPAAPTAEARSRWQQWGATPPAEAPAQPASQEPTPAPEPTEVRRASYDGNTTGDELQFPPATPTSDPAEQLSQAHQRLVQQLEQLGEKNPAAANQWFKYLALPEDQTSQLTGADFFASAAGREQLEEMLKRYDQVAGNPQFTVVARLSGFAATRNAARNLLDSLEQQPTIAEPQEPAIEAEVLPVPPLN